MDNLLPVGRFEAVELVDVAGGLGFPEGPVALDDGSLLVVELSTRRLTRIEPDGTTTTVAEFATSPNGAALGPDGALYIANNGDAFEFIDLGGLVLPESSRTVHRGGSIQRVDLSTGGVSTLYAECDGRPLVAPNDLVFDGRGGMWFTDHGLRDHRSADRGAVFYATADGSEIREVLSPLDSPNGIGLSPDGTRLYVAETYTGRVWSWQIEAPGRVVPGLPIFAGGAVHFGAPADMLYDSLAVDSDGSVCVATLQHGGITVISAAGGHGADGGVEFLPTPDPITTNICFGGVDRRIAWITLSGTGRVVRCEWPVPGAALMY